MISQEEINAYEQRQEQLRQLQEQAEQGANNLGSQQVNEVKTSKPEKKPVRSTSGRGAGRSAFQTSEQRQAQREAATKNDSESSRAIRDAAYNTEAKGPDRPDGLVTRLGEGLDWLMDGGAVSDGLNAVAAGINQITPEDSPLKPATQGLDDFILSNEEIEADRERQIAERDDWTGNVLGYGMAIEEGSQSGLLSPLTITGRMSNQATPWSEVPEVIKDKPVASAIFNIMEVLTPSLIVGAPLPPGVGGALVLGGESALETATQTESVEDVIGGRTIIRSLAEISEFIQPGSGEALAAELVAGETNKSKLLVTTLGFLQNLGINFGADQIFRALGQTPKPKPEVEAAARASGKTPQEVAESIADVETPPYRPDYEPSEVMDGNTIAPTSKPNNGNSYINEDALAAEAFRETRLDPDGLTRADANYFTNIRAVTDEKGAQAVLREATRTLERLGPAKKDIDIAVKAAGKWWDEMASYLDDDFAYFVDRFESDLTEVLPGKEGIDAFRPNLIDPIRPKWIENALRQQSVTTTEGFIVAPIVIERESIKTQMFARQAMNLDQLAKPADYTASVENMLTQMEKLELFVIPLRRGKRLSSTRFSVQNPETIKRVKDADIKRGFEDPQSAAAPRTELFGVQAEDGTYKSLRDYWEEAKAGNTEANQTFKAALNAIAYSEPSQITQNIDRITRILAEQFQAGKSNAVANIHYGMMLSGTATHLSSFLSNVYRLVGDPLGAMISGERAYGWGQLVGGWNAMGDAMRNVKTAWQQNAPITSGAKLDADIYNLRSRQTALESSYEGMVRQINAEGGDPSKLFGAKVWFLIQSAGNHPVVNAPGRALMAVDEGAKTVFASQVATGRAHMRFAEAGQTKSLDSLIKEELNTVFRDGVRTGKITDAEVLDGAKALALQSDIPKAGNLIDDAFLAIDNATKNSDIWRFVSPFTRVSYNILENYARAEPTGIFRAFVPRYKAILNGEMGLVAQQQLKSQIAFGQMTSLGVVGLALGGGMTGYNSGNMPKTSFIVPYPNAQGWVAIDYSRIEPFASYASFLADLTQAVRDDVISEGNYEEALSNVIFSLGMSTLDKSFLSGLTNFAGLLDPQNWGTGTIGNATGVAGSLAMPAIARQIQSFFNPYETNSNHRNNPLVTFIGKARNRLFAGAGNPIRYDELSGLPIERTTSMGGDGNYWRAVSAQVFRATIFPGQVKDAGENPNFRIPTTRQGYKDWGGPKGPAEVRAMLSALGFEHDDSSSLETFSSVALSPAQQSRVQQAMGEEGILLSALESYFSSDTFREDWLSYLDNRWNNPVGYQGAGSPSAAFMDNIQRDIRGRYRDSKQRAVWSALGDDPEFLGNYNRLHHSKLAPNATNPKLAGVQSLYGWAAGEVPIVDIDYESMVS